MMKIYVKFAVKKKMMHIDEINKSSNISFISSINMDFKQNKSYNRNILTIRTKKEKIFNFF